MLSTTTCKRSAFTLLELVLSLVVTTILMGALTSAMLLAGQAIPDAEKPLESTIATGEIANQMSGELYYALSFTERSAGAVTFTVADRDGDAAPETIRYAWSGTPGHSITRQYNGGTAAIMLENVQQFELGYNLKEVTDPPASTRYFVREVNITLRVSLDPSGRVDATARILNAPEVTGP